MIVCDGTMHTWYSQIIWLPRFIVVGVDRGSGESCGQLRFRSSFLRSRGRVSLRIVWNKGCLSRRVDMLVQLEESGTR